MPENTSEHDSPERRSEAPSSSELQSFPADKASFDNAMNLIREQQHTSIVRAQQLLGNQFDNGNPFQLTTEVALSNLSSKNQVDHSSQNHNDKSIGEGIAFNENERQESQKILHKLIRPIPQAPPEMGIEDEQRFARKWAISLFAIDLNLGVLNTSKNEVC